MVMTMMQNQIGLKEFADLECRASEVPQGTLHCTGRICKTTPRHPGNICETFSSFLGGIPSTKTKGPLHLRKHNLVPFKKTVPFALYGRSSNNKKIGRSKSQIFPVRMGFSPVFVCYTFLKNLFGTKDLDLYRTLLENIPPDT